MDWYYAEDNKRQTGPLSRQEFDAKVREGIIRPDTLVWNESLAEWKPLSALSLDVTLDVTLDDEFAAPEDSPATPEETFPDASALAEAICRRGYDVDIGSCLARSWKLLQTFFMILAGSTAFLVLIPIGADFLIGRLVPALGSILSMVLQGPLMGGLCALYLGIIRNPDREPAIDQMFSGFGPRLKQLILGVVAPNLIIYLFLSPAVIYGMATGQMTLDLKEFNPFAMNFIFWMLMLVGLLPAIFVSTCWTFVVPLIMDKNLAFLDAMSVSFRVVKHRWGLVFLLLLVAGALGFLGLLACGVGVFATLPAYYCMLLLAYEDIFAGKHVK